VAGFGASAIFGTFVGSWADKFGRRKFAFLYCVLYIISCMTKHVKSFNMLMLGRLTGGVATSLLFSVFDSWMVSEHNHRGFDADLLGGTFSVAMFGNSLVAILAGEIGEFAAGIKSLTDTGALGIHFGGFCAPFDVSILFLFICIGAMSVLWSENYGKESGKFEDGNALIENMSSGVQVIVKKPLVLFVGASCALFESSMFIFVFNWTPAVMEEGAPKPPFGHIFACFMVMSMLGSQLFMLLTQTRPIEQVGRWTFVLAAVALFVPVIIADVNTRFLSFLVFEMCVGMYFPMMGTLKGVVVPEESRSTIYNLYRVPLNVVVTLVLLLNVDMQAAFICTSFMMGAAVVCQTQVIKLNPFFAEDDADAEVGEGVGNTAAVESELAALKSNQEDEQSLGPPAVEMGVSAMSKVEAF